MDRTGQKQIWPVVVNQFFHAWRTANILLMNINTVYTPVLRLYYVNVFLWSSLQRSFYLQRIVVKYSHVFRHHIFGFTYFNFVVQNQVAGTLMSCVGIAIQSDAIQMIYWISWAPCLIFVLYSFNIFLSFDKCPIICSIYKKNANVHRYLQFQ